MSRIVAEGAALALLENLRPHALDSEEMCRLMRERAHEILDYIHSRAPRVMCLDELDGMDDEPVWLETEGRCFCVIVRSGGRLCAPENDEIPEELLESDYNVTWRLWNGKPAAETRMREKWGISEDEDPEQ